MSKKALLALCIAVLLPVTCYFIVKAFSEDAVHIPPRYYADSVSHKIVNGKKVTDTIWHKVANITLTNQLGKQVSLDDLKGRIIVADFFFHEVPYYLPLPN